MSGEARNLQGFRNFRVGLCPPGSYSGFATDVNVVYFLFIEFDKK